tara:strand:- start:1560 stop:2066 length:507 start_codon:yes stop_codon:yes gene_type:complete
MRITLGNKEFKFDNVSKRGKTLIFYDDIFDSEHILNKRVELNYDFSLELIKLSLRSYVHCDHTNRKISDYIEELFQFFKITNNQNVKRDLVSKIGYLLINNESVISDKVIINIFSSYKDKKNIYYKNDNFFKFIILLLKQKNTDLVEDFSINETDHFDLIDFIFDYYE